MKSQTAVARSARVLVLGVSFLGFGTAPGTPSTDLEAPVGTLSASKGLLRQGAFPTLQWEIQYPSSVKDYVEIKLPSTVVSKDKLDMEIRVLGAGVTASGSKGKGITFVPTEAKFSYNGSSYQRIFFGTNWDVNPNQVVCSKRVSAKSTLRFGGRYYWNKRWGTFRSSNDGTLAVRTLVNGEVPPTTFPLHQAPTLESFLKPYLDASGRVVIGPMDVIVFMELTHSDKQMKNSGYDLQDMALLITFKKVN